MKCRRRFSFKFHSHPLRLGSIRAKFILSFFLVSIIPMIFLAVISYRAYLDILQRNSESYSGEVIDRVDRNLQIYISDLERILESRGDYYNVQFIKLSHAGDIEGNRKYTFRITHSDLTQNELFQTLANQNTQADQTVIWGPHPDWLGGRVFSVSRAIRGDYDNLLGMMTIDVDVKLLDRICHNITLGKTGYVMLVAADGQIIYHPQPELVGKTLGSLLGDPMANQWKSGYFTTKIGSAVRVIAVKTFTPANWKIVALSNKAELTAEMRKITGLTLEVIIVTIIALIFVAVFLAGLLAKPIQELQNSMRRASDDLNTNVRVRSNDEIGQLGHSFNQMLARIRQLMAESVREQKKLRRAEMNALQEQIKPHFIYNTLDLLIGMLETRQNEEVIKMVEALGAFFRISLSHGREMISIREETEHIRNYLYLQKARHGDQYKYRLEIEPAILSCRTLKLILQPLVENAIYHGVRDIEAGRGLILIRGYREGDTGITLEVSDNGRGMTAGQRDEINRCLRSRETRQSYFGLCNVNERIRLAFGAQYGIELETNAAGGITVKVSLPVVMAGSANHDGNGRYGAG
jgi:two-component system sensor histidine kinase YesM